MIPLIWEESPSPLMVSYRRVTYKELSANGARCRHIYIQYTRRATAIVTDPGALSIEVKLEIIQRLLTIDASIRLHIDFENKNTCNRYSFCICELV